MKNVLVFVITAISALVISGCATTVNVADNANVYSMPEIAGAPRIIIADLSDNRSDKTKVGTVCALIVNTKKPINIILTNRIAVELRNAGFNVQKAELGKIEDGNKIAEILATKDGVGYLSGGIGNFLFASFDAVMEKAKGNVTFYIKIYDKSGTVIFDKSYSAYAENWIGLTGAAGCEKTVELSLQASVDELFKDKEFRNVLEKIKHM